MLVVALGCGDEDDGRAGDSAFTSLTTLGGDAGTVGDDDDDDDATGDDDDDDNDDDDDDDEIKFDVPGGEAGDPPPEEEGCEKVDFVFVIDSSPSMGDE